MIKLWCEDEFVHAGSAACSICLVVHISPAGLLFLHSFVPSVFCVRTAASLGKTRDKALSEREKERVEREKEEERRRERERLRRLARERERERERVAALEADGAEGRTTGGPSEGTTEARPRDNSEGAMSSVAAATGAVSTERLQVCTNVTVK